MADESKGPGFEEVATKVAVDLVKQSYADAVQPALKEAGKLFALPFRMANAMWRRVDAVLADDELQFEAVKKAMAAKWAAIPPHRLLSPPGNIAGPWLEGYTWVQDAGEAPLRELYEQLLASAMDSEARPGVHPAFVDMLRQMTAREARMLRTLATTSSRQLPLLRLEARKVIAGRTSHRTYGLTHPFEEEGTAGNGIVAASIANLQRLGLFDVTFEKSMLVPDDYVSLQKEAEEALSKEMAEDPGISEGGWFPHPHPGYIGVTRFGETFIDACISPDGKES